MNEIAIFGQLKNIECGSISENEIEGDRFTSQLACTGPFAHFWCLRTKNVLLPVSRSQPQSTAASLQAALGRFIAWQPIRAKPPPRNSLGL
jgi:hypothetical protein